MAADPLDLCPFAVRKLAFVITMDNKRDYDKNKKEPGFRIRNDIRANIYHDVRVNLYWEITRRKFKTKEDVEKYVTDIYFEEADKRIGEVLA